jgi:signal transduction histidine kinase
MNWFRPKVIYFLITLSLVVSAGLQVIWLKQLFSGLKNQLKEEIERVVSTTTQKSMYDSMTTTIKPGNNRQTRNFFLSPQWEELREAFEHTNKMEGVIGHLSVDLGKDSTTVQMLLSVKDSSSKKNPTAAHLHPGITLAQLAFLDSVAVVRLNGQLDTALRNIGIHAPIYHNLTDSRNTAIFATHAPAGLAPAFTSGKYFYNIQKVHRYQLVLPAINSLVWYRMRYYLASCILMLLLTVAAFYFILRLLRKQQLYATAKSNFTSNMTHEFKTPIATVSVAIESINKYHLINDPNTLQQYLDISQHELRRLDLMVEKVLDINNENDTGQSLKLELYEVQAGIQQVISSMRLQLQNSNSTISFTPSEKPCFVMGDALHLTNVFYNLIDNAIKYSGKNMELKIRCLCETDQVILNFEDNGPGIDKLYHKDIFERFFRVPVKGDTHDVKGFGLGLNYIKQMTEKHGGKIKIKSVPGHGCNFILILPTAS